MVEVKTQDRRAQEVEGAISALLAYCQASGWAGVDPYDALNSRLFRLTPLDNHKISRLVFVQLMKRLPVNIRPLLMIDQAQNPKAIALILMALLKLESCGFPGAAALVPELIETALALRSPESDYWCWGYSFPWQSRSVLVPRSAPNLVATVFVANALVDAYQQGRGAQCMTAALSAGRYLARELYWSEGSGLAGFSYPLPRLRTRIHNANLLAAALLSRLSRLTGEAGLIEPALAAARYSVSCQRPDGAWSYGEDRGQGWVDNFHTGYNLCALKGLSEHLSTDEFEPPLNHGFQFYRRHFFRKDGAPRYFHDRTYPIDIHSVAQSIITLLELKDRDRENLALAETVLEWALRHMRHREGFFYFQKLPLYKNRISYMRWSQAWMLLALSTLLPHAVSPCEPLP
jgi:hypothetical protein